MDFHRHLCNIAPQPAAQRLYRFDRCQIEQGNLILEVEGYAPPEPEKISLINLNKLPAGFEQFIGWTDIEKTGGDWLNWCAEGIGQSFKQTDLEPVAPGPVENEGNHLQDKLLRPHSFEHGYGFLLIERKSVFSHPWQQIFVIVEAKNLEPDGLCPVCTISKGKLMI